MHTGTRSYPLAQVEFAVDEQVLTVEARVSQILPVMVLLGTDISQLVTLLSGEKEKVEAGESVPDEALAVTMRAQSQRDVHGGDIVARTEGDGLRCAAKECWR